MINHTPDLPEVSDHDYTVVLIGDFNPKIYHPVWFAAQGLLRASEAEDADIGIIHADFAIFSTAWFAMQVTRNSFTLAIQSAAYRTHLRDLVLGTFRLLSHTPLSQMGINYSARVRFRNERDWHCFGHFLSPKSPWVGLLQKPGMRSISVQGVRPDDLPGHVLVTAAPVLPNAANEVVVRVNDHCERSPDSRTEGSDFFIDMIGKNFDVSIDSSKAIIDRLLERFSEQRTFDDGE